MRSDDALRTAKQTVPPPRSIESDRRFDLFLRRMGNSIRKHRERRGLTQRQLGGRTKPSISAGHVSQVERGVSAPSLQVLFDITVALHLDINQLLGDVVRSGVASTEATTFLKLYEALSAEDRVIALKIMKVLVRGAWEKRVLRQRTA